MGNEFEGLADALPTPQDRETARGLAVSQDFASTRQPEVAAQAYQYAKDNGVHFELAEEMQAEPAPQVDASWAGLERLSPTLAKALQDRGLAAAARDDVENLSLVEKLFRGWQNIPAGIPDQYRAGRRTMALGHLGMKQAEGRATPADIAEIKRLQAEARDNPELQFGYLAKFIPATANLIAQWADPLATDPELIWQGGAVGAGIGGAHAVAGGPLAPVTVPIGFAGGFLSGVVATNTALAIKSNGDAEGGNAYLEFSEIPGVDHEAAAAGGQLIRLLNSGIEFVGFDKIVEAIPAARYLAKDVAKGAIREVLKNQTKRAAFLRMVKSITTKGLLEGLQEAAQDVTVIFEGIRLRPEEPGTWDAFKETFGDPKNQARILKSFEGGTQMVGAGVPASVTHLVKDLGRAKEAEKWGGFYKALGEAASGSKTRERLPSVFRSFVDSVQRETGGPVESVKVPASALRTLFQKEEVTEAEVAKEMPEVARQLQEAAEQGTPDLEVAVPIADMATKIAPLSGYAGLHEDMRIGDGLTIREARQVMTEAERIYTEQKDPAREATPAEKVADDIGAKLEAAGWHPKVAREQAVLWAAFAESRAARTGAKDAWDYYGRQKIDIQHGENVPAGALAQTLNDTTGVRGAVSFDNARTLFAITLTGKANLSTFLHESGHSFVEMLRRDGEAGHAESAADVAALAEFAGVQGGNWTTENLETLAKAFEKYLAEGEAPSNKLEAAFRSFKDWLAMIYRAMVGLNVELDDKTRQVFARLLATDQEINERARVTGLTMPEYGEVQGGIFSAAEHARLKAMWDDGVAAMKESLLAQSVKALRRDLDSERKRIEKEVSAELNADQTQNAWAWLSTGQRLDDAQVDLEHGKLGAQAVKDAPLTDQERRRLKKVVTEDFGLSADDVAPYFGFASGSDLIVALARRESLQKARRRMVDERMAALYPDGTAEAVASGADAAVAKQLEGRLGRVLEAELDAVGQKVGGEKGRVILEAIRQAARRQVAGMTLTELEPARYARAAKKAAQDYLDAIARGDGAIAAFQAKRAQAWALAMWRAAVEAQAQGEKIRRYLDSFDDMPKRSRLARAGGNYLAAIDALLDGIEFRKRSGVTLEKRAALAAYLAEMEANGETVNIPLEARTDALLKNYRQMSLDELVGVEAAVGNLEALARLKNKLTGIQAARRLGATSEQLANNIHKWWTEKAPKALHAGVAETLARSARSANGQLQKIERLVKALDGGEVAGLAHELIFQPIARAEAEKMRLIEQVLGEFKKPFDAMSIEERMRLHRTVDFLGEKMPFSSVLAIALNWGTESNRDKLVRGMAARGWTEESVQARLDELMEARDWQLVTHVWKTIDSLFPMIQALAKRAVGVEVEKVGGVTIQTRHGPVQGSYYPMVYDRNQPAPRTGKGQALRSPEELAQMKSGQLFENNFMSPGGLVEKGFTKGRTKYAAPVNLSLSVVPAHVSEVIHYLTHYEAVRDVDKLLRQDQVKTAIEDALGVEGYRQFRPWLQAVANAGRADAAAMFYEGWLRKARLGSSIVMLGGKLTTGLVQALGLFPVMNELKTKHFLSGFGDFLKHGFKEAREASPSFRYQEEHFDRDLGAMYDRMASTFGEVSHLKQQVATMSLAWIKLIQGSVNAITWYGARNQAEAVGHKDPVAYADSVVRLTQSAGGVKDLAQVQRGTEAQKLFTVMYTYFSTLYGQLTEPIPDTKTGRQKAAIMAARWWWSVMLPVAVEAALRGKKPENGDEPEDWATFLLKEQFLYSARTVPLLGDILTAGVSGRSPRGNPWLTTMYNGAQAVHGVFQDDPLTNSEKRALLDALGALTSSPTTGISNAYRYLDAFTSGRMEEPVQNLLFRSPGAWR